VQERNVDVFCLFLKFETSTLKLLRGDSPLAPLPADVCSSAVFVYVIV
jgi:hypothetical protein